MDEDDAAADPAAGDQVTEWISTGSLPSDEEIRSIVEAGYERFRHEDEGRVADYIPALAEASPHTFGVCVAGVHGGIFAIGDAEQEFTIQSISKLFVFALVCNALGPAEARQKLGVNSTGMPFDSVMGIELNEDRTMNPMVNAGALATIGDRTANSTASVNWLVQIWDVQSKLGIPVTTLVPREAEAKLGSESRPGNSRRSFDVTRDRFTNG